MAPDEDIDGSGRAVGAPHAAAPHNPPSFTATPCSDDGVLRCDGGQRRSTSSRAAFTQSRRPEAVIADGYVAGDPGRSPCTRALPGNDVILRLIRLHTRGPVQRAPLSTPSTLPIQAPCRRVHGIAVLLLRIGRPLGLPRRSCAWPSRSSSARSRRIARSVARASRHRRWMSQQPRRGTVGVDLLVGSTSPSSPSSSTLPFANGGDLWMRRPLSLSVCALLMLHAEVPVLAGAVRRRALPTLRRGVESMPALPLRRSRRNRQAIRRRRSAECPKGTSARGDDYVRS